jgi:uracil-DNA glycosylase family 4
MTLPEGAQGSPSPSVPTNEIYEKYLEKAIAEINELGHEIAAAAPSRQAPVLGSGHPLADVMLLKEQPRAAEVQEGVAFYGRAGDAILKSLQRLRVDPLGVYGTNCFKYEEQAEAEARAFLTHEVHIVQPKLIVTMGEAAVEFVNGLEFPLSQALEPRFGEVQQWTPTVDALVTPDIDASLDEQAAKTRFWRAFKALGPWWAELPPY